MVKIDKILFFAAVLILLSCVFAFSADDEKTVSGPEEPAETEIILPQMYLEIEDLTVEEIEAVIPDDTEVMLSALELPLPAPDDIEIPADAFALADETAPASFASAAEDGGANSSFFSEGTIGAGTSARISGDINLYHIGAQPDFRLRYFHDSSDGFAGQEAGKGYSSREELIEAELNYTDEKVSAELIAGYNELEDGLQGNADFFTVTRRNPSLEGNFDLKLSDLFGFTGNLDASTATLQLNSLNPASFRSFTVEPEAGIIFGTEKYNIGLNLDYGINGQTGDSAVVQDLGGRLAFTAGIADIFGISGEAGILWNNFDSVYYPFTLEFSGTADVFDYSIGGGYRTYYIARTELWNIFPAAAGPVSDTDLGSFPLTRDWFSEGSFRWNISDNVSFNGSVGFSMLKNAVKPTDSALNGFSSFTTASSTCLDAGAGVYIELTDRFNLSAGWEGQLFDDLDWFRPRHLFEGEVEYTSADKNMGITGSVLLNVYDSEQSWYDYDNWLPELGLETYIRIADGFMFSIEGHDLASALFGEHRTVWNSYLDKGAMLQAKIKISL